jgi:phosphate transport system permease protein
MAVIRGEKEEMMVTKKFWRQGEPYVWATSLALSLILFMTFFLFYVVLANGIMVFWPQKVTLATLTDGGYLLGEIIQEEKNPATGKKRMQFKIGNRDLYGLDFKWVDDPSVKSLSLPADVYVLERQEHGNFYGSLKELKTPGLILPGTRKESLQAALDAIEPQRGEVKKIERQIAVLNRQVEENNNKLARLRYHKKENTPVAVALQVEAKNIKGEFERLVALLDGKRAIVSANEAVMVDANGQEKTIALANIVRCYQPNSMSWLAKWSYYGKRLGELLFAEPRESNTEGGLFPAIFGTIMLIFLMSILSFPLGVIAGIYLREYAREGYLVQMVRIAVNNLAGIPSIVYGIFGLGFFVYGIGGQIDQLFFPEMLPTPTFGTGGILWASLTLGLLTVPVVIVATEEALGAIPPGIREGSQALAATKFQTLTRILLPMASPGILTGFILAMARAAGEVAPLMITGVVKLAPALPLDGSFPYLHLDRKFMHLGFHIYDIGFQSPNVEAAKPMVYVTTLLLILIVLIMTSTAIHLRNRMRERFSVADL